MGVLPLTTATALLESEPFARKRAAIRSARGIGQCLSAGATACIQPGGSIRDEEVIAAADAAGMAIIFTGHRHFRH